MLANWMKILPYFFIQYLAKKYCQIIEIKGIKYYEPFEGILIKLK